MDRREKREQREQEIIEQSISLFAEQGFLGVRMSDVARETQYSMGTIYSHFESKEDLLVACAQRLVEEHRMIFHLVQARPIPAMEQIIALVQALWMVSIHFPELLEIENLALMPSVWRRATVQRVEQYDHLHVELADEIRAMAQEALPDNFPNYLDLEPQEQADFCDVLTHGLWGLSIGLNSIIHSAYAKGKSERESCQNSDIVDFFTTNHVHFLQGYGWQSEAPFELFERGKEIALATLEQTSWFNSENRGYGDEK